MAQRIPVANGMPTDATSYTTSDSGKPSLTKSRYR